MQIATKFGISKTDGKIEIRGDPEYVRACCEASLKRLDVDCIDLYYAHRIDSRVPIEVTVSLFLCSFRNFIYALSLPPFFSGHHTVLKKHETVNVFLLCRLECLFIVFSPHYCFISFRIRGIKRY